MLNFLFEKTPLYLMTQSLWRDEAFSFVFARMHLLDMIKLTAKDFNPPLYYLLLHFWIKIFGTSEIALRCLSLVFFAINIYVVYLFLKKIFKVPSRKIPIYLLLFSLNPLLLYYAFEARMYSLFALLSTLSFYFMIRKKYRLNILTSIIGVYTHYFFLFVIFTQILYFYAFNKKDFINRLKVALIPIIIFLPWFFYTFQNLIFKTADTWILKTSLWDLFSSLGILLTGYESKYYSYYHIESLILSVALVGFIMFFFFKKHFEKDRLFYLLLFWSFAAYFFALILSFIKPFFVPRYLIFSGVGFYFLLVYLLERLNKKGWFLAIILLFFVISHYTLREIKYRRKEDARSKITTIKVIASKKDYLYLRNPLHYFLSQYYFDMERVYVYKDPKDTIPYYVGLALIPEDRITLKLPVFPSKVFILDRDFNYEVKSVI